MKKRILIVLKIVAVITYPLIALASILLCLFVRALKDVKSKKSDSDRPVQDSVHAKNRG